MATTDIYTLSLHDALPIFPALLNTPFGFHNRGNFPGDFLVPLRKLHVDLLHHVVGDRKLLGEGARLELRPEDRKSTRLNSSHLGISYAVFCLKKKKHNPKE